MDELDELYGIRQKISPEDYVAGMRQNLAVYKSQRAAVLAEVDSFSRDETLPLPTRSELVRQRVENLRSLDWRIEDIERRLKQTAEVAMGLKPEKDGATA